ncbi:MAG: zinc ribbon domain-containing protein [Coriobacteriales bacterium]|nr:zinc ribbon domain-containing protein [Coriobacteriales bacterium]
MRCPNCGTLVRDGAGVCPACHATLEATAAHAPGEVTWCESCGAAIPVGEDTCPTCGMPVGGVFEEVFEEAPPQSDDMSTLVSAIPPDPSETPDDLHTIEERPRRLRLLLLAACAALVLVGGATLFITRPWDPEAYTIHATTDADTSMEGFPGTVTHLSSQDRIEDEVWQGYLGDVNGFLDGFYQRMGEMSLEAEVLYDSLSSLSSKGDMASVAGRSMAVAKLRDELIQTSTLATRLVLPDTKLDERRDKLLVLSTYLRGELDILEGAWTAASSEGNVDAASIAARIALQRASAGRDFSEWHDLFSNAYEM